MHLSTQSITPLCNSYGRNISKCLHVLFHVTCTVSSQYSLLSPLDHLHWSLPSLKITNHSFQHAAPHLWNKLPPTLSVAYHSDAPSSPKNLYHYPLNLHRLLTFLMMFFTLILKPSSSQSSRIFISPWAKPTNNSKKMKSTMAGNQKGNARHAGNL